MDKALRDILAAITLAASLLLSGQQGMIPVIDTKPSGSAPLNPCLVSGWPMNEGSGATLHDVSANSNTATSFSPVWGSNAGFPGSSLTMPSSHASTTSTTLANFDGTTPFSLAAWVSVTGSTNQPIMTNLASAGTYIGWELTVGTSPIGSNKMGFFLDHNTTNRIAVAGSTTVGSTGVHYLVVTYDGTGVAAGVKLYVDGVAETPTVAQDNLSGLSAASGVAPGLGARPADSAFMSGVSAANAIYNCVLTPTQISTYNALGPQVN